MNGMETHSYRRTHNHLQMYEVEAALQVAIDRLKYRWNTIVMWCPFHWAQFRTRNPAPIYYLCYHHLWFQTIRVLQISLFGLLGQLQRQADGKTKKMNFIIKTKYWSAKNRTNIIINFKLWILCLGPRRYDMTRQKTETTS